MGRCWSWLAYALAALSCGGSPAKPGARPTIDVVAPAPAAEARGQDVQREPSELVKRHWVLGDSEAALYADFAGLARTELFSALTKALLTQPELTPTPAGSECIQDALRGVREIATAAGRGQALTLVSFEPAAFRTPPARCLSSLMSLSRVRVEKEIELYEQDGELLAIKPGLLLFGTREAVTEALKPEPVSVGFPSGLALSADKYVAFELGGRMGFSGFGGLVVTATRFRLELRADLTDEKRAIGLEQRLRNKLKLAESQSPIPRLGGLIDALTIRRDRRWLIGALEFRGTASEQAKQLGVIVALAVHGVRKYIQNAKQAEARSTLAAIAKAHVASWHATASAASKQKLSSLPVVPKAIPRGTKYQSAPTEWQAWKRIGFSISDPQYYQYEVIAARDGSSAKIVARGDLDGNGSASTFTLEIEVDAGELSIAPSIDETDPNE